MRQFRILLSIVIAHAFVISAQITWQTTNTTDRNSSGQCNLESNSIRMVIHPFYIDVEEEAVISAQGQVSYGDPTSLLIQGQFQLSPGSSVRSALVWNGNVLYKAKLREKINVGEGEFGMTFASIQKAGENSYQFRIFPAGIGIPRKIRILYTVPLSATNLGALFTIKTAFIYGCIQTPAVIPIEFGKSDDVSFSCLFTHGTRNTVAQIGATYLIPAGDLITSTTTWQGTRVPTGAADIFLKPDSTNLNRAYQSKVDSPNAKGWYTAIFAGFPDTLSAMINELQLSDYTVEAKVLAGGKTYVSDLPDTGCFGLYLKTESPWNQNVYWSLYKSDGTLVYQLAKTFIPDSLSASSAMAPLVWAAKYNLTERTGSYGALFGFVDDKMELIAAPQDSIPSADALRWKDEGVPTLSPDEIFIAAEDIPVLPPNNAIFEYSGVRNAPQDILCSFRIAQIGGNRVLVEFGKRPDGAVSIMVVDMSGKLVYRLERASLAGTSLTMTLPSGLRGVYLMRVTTGREMHQKKFVIK